MSTSRITPISSVPITSVPSAWALTEIVCTSESTGVRSGCVRLRLTCDISRDGMLGGPNFLAIQEVVEHAAGLPSPMAVIASGGVSTVEHLKRLRLIGVEGVIIGMALYTGALDIAEALAAAEA
ncbi:MAG: hypothetical protein IIC25_05585 [Chloroflexi bacterium]|nr:hypothetical protein [Chloroflexota bacterium]